MLTKTPKSTYKRYISLGLKTALLLEGVGLAASYSLWYKLNTDRDFRFYMYQKHNWVLEGYYGLGEKLAEQNTRSLDEAVWKTEGRI